MIHWGDRGDRRETRSVTAKRVSKKLLKRLEVVKQLKIKVPHFGGYFGSVIGSGIGSGSGSRRPQFGLQ